MRKGIGICCILLGMTCLLAAAGFVLYNNFESKTGAQSSQTLLQGVQEKIEESAQVETEEIGEETITAEFAEIDPGKMTTVSVQAYDSIGVLTIPVLELELPVLADWSYEKLKKAPCHYYGSCYESDFVIAAHNYPSHFGRLSELQQGDLIFFTDVLGELHSYEVVLLETLEPTATEEMITSGFDLSLYTCTIGGSNRVTVRCRAVV